MSYQIWKGKQIMKDYEQLKMMEYPKDRIDLVIDTDAATEIDDQFAIAYAPAPWNTNPSGFSPQRCMILTISS